MLFARIQKILKKCGYTIYVYSNKTNNTPKHLNNTPITNTDDLVIQAADIPTMLSEESGKMLYTLCYIQKIAGNVVEIGSRQGYSTSFLAKAVQDANNGTLFAIDHFQGNLGKEEYYQVGEKNLSDLKDNFIQHMKTIGVYDSIHLLDMPNHEAATMVIGPIRFLFIDGDHTKEGVEKDIELFLPFTMPGSIIVFDDFATHFPGLVEAVEILTRNRTFSRIHSYRNSLVLVV